MFSRPSAPKRGRGGGRASVAPRPLNWASIGLEKNLLRDVCADPSRVSRPELTDLLKPMQEALDPDNGIEAEYWPSTNKVYVWRAFRLLCGQRLKSMNDVGSEHDFVDVVCKFYGVKNPRSSSSAKSGGAAAAAVAAESAKASGGTAPVAATGSTRSPIESDAGAVSAASASGSPLEGSIAATPADADASVTVPAAAVAAVGDAMGSP